MIIPSRFFKLTAAVAVLSAFALYADEQPAEELAVSGTNKTAGTEKTADAQPAAESVVAATNKTADTEETSRMKAEAVIQSESREKTADEYYEMARKDFIEGSFRTSSEHSLKALEVLRDGKPAEEDALQPQDVQKKISAAKTLLSKAYYNLALEMFVEAEKSMSAKMYDEAIEKCNEAVAVDPDNKEIKEYSEALIKKFTRLKEASEYNDETAYNSKEVDPQGEDRQLKIEREMRKGQQFYKTRQWAKARDHFQVVLQEDPYNEMAIDYLRRCFLHLIDAGRRRHDVVTLERNADAAWKSVQSIVTPANVDGIEDLNESMAKVDDTKNIEGKLKDIIIPKLDFEDQTLKEVIGILRRRSKELDPDKNGVNILLFLTNKSAEGEGEDGSKESGSSESSEEEASDKDESSDSKEKSANDKSDDDEDSDSKSADAEKEAAASGRSDHMIDYLKVENVSLGRAISLVCDSAGVKYRVEPHAVLIADDGVPLDECELKVFVVEKDVLGIFGGSAEGEGSGSSGSSDKDETDSTSLAIKKYLIDHGVPFPPNAAVKYDNAVSRLVVSNTPEALSAIGTILDQLNTEQTNQVLIQVKFVEVQLKDLEELGFEYVISRPTDYGGSILNDHGELLTPNVIYDEEGKPIGSGVITPPNYSNGGREPYTLVYYDRRPTTESVLDNKAEIIPLNTAEFANTVTVPARADVVLPYDSAGQYYAVPLNQSRMYGKSVTWGPNSPLVRNAIDNTSNYTNTMVMPKSDTVVNWSHQDKKTGLNVDAKIHALDLADSTDLLSAPRVATLANEQAVIKMVTERYYPDEWSKPTLQTLANGTIPVFQPSIPSFGDATSEGIVLNVTPQVEENFTITLSMTPMIQHFVGWTDYSYQIPLESGGQTKYFPNTLKKAIIEARSVETTVVSYDGETIVLGGIVKDRISTVDDQYPILGDIPLIGRLFQSKGRGSEKTNLLIFMTSRLIKPDGSPIRENVERGMPSFRY